MREIEGGRSGAAVALIFAAFQALAFGGRFLMALLAAPVSAALRIDDLHMGLLQGTAFIVPFVVFTPIFGALTDRFPRGGPLIAGLGLSATAMAWAAMADSFDALLGARVLLGVGEAAIAPAALAAIAAATRRRAGLGVGLFAAGGPIGKGLALAAGGALLAALAGTSQAIAPWRIVLWAAAGLNLLAVVAAWRLRPSQPRPTERVSRTLQSPSPTRADPALLAASATAGVAAVLVSQTAAAWAPSFFSRNFALTTAQAGIVAGSPLLLLSPACGLAVGWALDRFGARAGGRPPVTPWLAVCLVGTGGVALALAAAPDLAWAEALFSLLAAAGSVGAVTALRGVQLYAGDAWRARTTALFIAAANLVGFGVGPPLVGWLARTVGLRTALGSVLACAAFAGAATAATLFVAGRRRTGRGEGSRAPSSANDAVGAQHGLNPR